VSQNARECNQLNKGSKENFILTVLNGTLNGTAYQLGFFTPYTGPGAPPTSAELWLPRGREAAQ